MQVLGAHNRAHRFADDGDPRGDEPGDDHGDEQYENRPSHARQIVVEVPFFVFAPHMPGADEDADDAEETRHADYFACLFADFQIINKSVQQAGVRGGGQRHQQHAHDQQCRMFFRIDQLTILRCYFGVFLRTC